MEYVSGINYACTGLLNTSSSTQSKTELEKSCVKMLLGLAQSNRERECICYAIYKSSGMTATRARKVFGFEDMDKQSKRVEDAIE